MKINELKKRIVVECLELDKKLNGFYNGSSYERGDILKKLNLTLKEDDLQEYGLPYFYIQKGASFSFNEKIEIDYFNERIIESFSCKKQDYVELLKLLMLLELLINLEK